MSLSSKKHQIRVQSLGRLLVYMLGHRPDEFGLVPDREGFVPCKQLLQAFHEEPAWQYVRQSHINEVLLGKERALFQAEGNRIRAMDRKWQLDFDHPSATVPKILFTGVRKKAHPVVMAKGLSAPEGMPIAFSSDQETALRIGRRRDREPVLLEVSAAAAARTGISFYPFGILFLSHGIPNKFIVGPPVPKTMEEKVKDKPMTPSIDLSPGTFSLEISMDPDLARRARGKKPRGWKEAARNMRRGKKP